MNEIAVMVSNSYDHIAFAQSLNDFPSCSYWTR